MYIYAVFLRTTDSLTSQNSDLTRVTPCMAGSMQDEHGCNLELQKPFKGNSPKSNLVKIYPVVRPMILVANQQGAHKMCCWRHSQGMPTAS
jgi:hypothetical protein